MGNRFHTAAKDGDLKVLESELDKGVDVDSVTKDDPPETALIIAARYGKLEAVKLLVSRGALIDKEDRPGHTALVVAAFFGHTPVVEFLLDKGADIAKTDWQGWQPLHYAAMFGHESVVKLLLQRKADFTVKATDGPDEGKTPLELAKQKNHAGVVALLQAAADPSRPSPMADKLPARGAELLPVGSIAANNAGALSTAETVSKLAELCNMFVLLDDAFAGDLTNCEEAVLSMLVNKAGARQRLLRYIETLKVDKGVPLTRMPEPEQKSDAGDKKGGIDLSMLLAESKLTTLEGDRNNPQAEFWQVEKNFLSSLHDNLDDYNSARTKKGLGAVKFRLSSAQRVNNSTLEQRFAQCQAKLTASGRCRPEELNPRYLFHGTQPMNIKSICTNGLLRAGHPLNPSKRVDEGTLGLPEQGINLTKHADCALKYSNPNGLKPLAPGETVRVFMCRAVTGVSRHLNENQSGMRPADSPGCHSHSSSNFKDVYLFTEEQCCPAYLLTVSAYAAPQPDPDHL